MDPAVTLPSTVRLVDDPAGLPYLDISTAAARARVFLHGAHVAAWTPARSMTPVLWISPHSQFRHDKAIRGGVPICFPWFGAHASSPNAPAHGFARMTDWRLTEAFESGHTVTLTFTLETSAETSPFWPHRSRASFQVTVGPTLEMNLTVENLAAEPITFEAALHTYFAVKDIESVSISGLEETDYLDKPTGFARLRQGPEPIRFIGETDRVYLDTISTCRIHDPGWSRTIVVSKSGSRSTVVWNPWRERAAAMSDFGADEWRRMVCVETANAGIAAIRLPAGGRHTMGAIIAVDE